MSMTHVAAKLTWEPDRGVLMPGSPYDCVAQ
jgi:hypothetical protein